MLYGPLPSWYGTPQCTSLLRLLPHDQALDKQQKGWMDGWMDVMRWRKQCQHHLSMEKAKVSHLTSTCRLGYCTICVCETL